MKKIVIPLICFVVFFGFGCANKEEQAGKTADIKSEINLGGGYKNLKWGMSKDTVIKMMNQKVAKDLGDQIVFNLGRDQYTAAGETKYLSCFFYKDKLWKVGMFPGFGNINHVSLVLSDFESKFGKPIATNSADGELMLGWNDGETELIVVLMDRNKRAPQTMSEVYPQYVFVAYIGVEIRDKMLAAQSNDVASYF